MNKAIMLVFVSIFLFSFASATYCPGCDFDNPPFGKTVIYGQITYGNNGSVVGGASVEVICNGNEKTTISGTHGYYHVLYDQSQCNYRDYATVNAQKGDLFGSKTEKVNDWKGIFVDVERINVPIVPEFGIVVGMLTIMSAIVVFFVVRKN